MSEALAQIVPGEIVEDLVAKTPEEKKRVLKLVNVSNRIQSVTRRTGKEIDEEMRQKHPLRYKIKPSERKFFEIAMSHLARPILERPIKVDGKPTELRLIDRLQENGQDAVAVPQLGKIRIVMVAAGVGAGMAAVLGGFLAYQHSHHKK